MPGDSKGRIEGEMSVKLNIGPKISDIFIFGVKYGLEFDIGGIFRVNFKGRSVKHGPASKRNLTFNLLDPDQIRLTLCYTDYFSLFWP